MRRVLALVALAVLLVGCSNQSAEVARLQAEVAALKAATAPGSPVVTAKSDMQDPRSTTSQVFAFVLCISYQIGSSDQKMCKQKLELFAGATTNQSTIDNFQKTADVVQACYDQARIGGALPDCWSRLAGSASPLPGQ